MLENLFTYERTKLVTLPDYSDETHIPQNRERSQFLNPRKHSNTVLYLTLQKLFSEIKDFIWMEYTCHLKPNIRNYKLFYFHLGIFSSALNWEKYDFHLHLLFLYVLFSTAIGRYPWKLSKNGMHELMEQSVDCWKCQATGSSQEKTNLGIDQSQSQKRRMS